METRDQANLVVIRQYLKALEAMATGDALACFFAPDAIQVELPNRLNPNGGTSDLPTLLKRAELAPKLLQSQRYTVVSELAAGANVAVEASWSAVLAMAFGTLPAGAQMKAHFAMFFEMEGGRIKTQRNYDCFEPW